MIMLEETIAFETYSKLFDFICEMDEEIQWGKLPGIDLEPEESNWRFVSYSPGQVDGFHPFVTTKDPNFQKAYFEQWGLLEICAGDYKDTRYIPLTADLDMEELKKEWLYGYCKAHGLALAENFSERQKFKPLVGCKSVAPWMDISGRESMGGAL